ELPHAVRGRRILDERPPEHGAHGLGREVVRGRPDAAGRDDDVGLRERLPPRPFQALRIVADRDHRDDVDAELEELVGDPLRVRVGDAPGRELVAGRQEGGTLDHSTSSTSRVTMPAYAPATRSSPTTATPPRPRRSIAPAGKGFTTSKIRKTTN